MKRISLVAAAALLIAGAQLHAQQPAKQDSAKKHAKSAMTSTAKQAGATSKTATATAKTAGDAPKATTKSAKASSKRHAKSSTKADSSKKKP